VSRCDGFTESALFCRQLRGPLACSEYFVEVRPLLGIRFEARVYGLAQWSG
jgi:hypothetical protein